jgi:hypothetical protein
MSPRACFPSSGGIAWLEARSFAKNEESKNRFRPEVLPRLGATKAPRRAALSDQVVVAGQIRRAEDPCGLSDPAVRQLLRRAARSAKDLVAGAGVPEGDQASRDSRLLLAFGGLQLPELIQFA